MNITDYIHYYINQRMQMIVPGAQPSVVEIKEFLHAVYRISYTKFIPILRKLSDMSEEEMNESVIILEVYGTVARFHWVLRKGFWIFGDDAFSQGLIIDAKTLEV